MPTTASYSLDENKKHQIVQFLGFIISWWFGFAKSFYAKASAFSEQNEDRCLAMKWKELLVMRNSGSWRTSKIWSIGCVIIDLHPVTGVFHWFAGVRSGQLVARSNQDGSLG